MVKLFAIKPILISPEDKLSINLEPRFFEDEMSLLKVVHEELKKNWRVDVGR